MSGRYYHQSSIRRFARHLYYEARGVAPVFGRAALKRIEVAVATSELTHTAEVRVAVEASLTLRELIAGKNPRARAIEAFSLLRVWDTQQNNGVLIYINVADRAVEIVADRGLSSALPDRYWKSLCSEMTKGFKQDRFEESLLQCVRELSQELSRLFPVSGAINPNELPNAPAVL
jgi:uncharacterized membrane protein